MRKEGILSLSKVNATFLSLLNRFLDHLLLEKGLSKNTHEAYRNDLLRYLFFLQERRIEEISMSQAQDVRDLVLLMSDLGMASSSVARNITAIRMFYRYLMDLKYGR
jgi:integrase/recombinase XerD